MRVRSHLVAAERVDLCLAVVAARHHDNHGELVAEALLQVCRRAHLLGPQHAALRRHRERRGAETEAGGAQRVSTGGRLDGERKVNKLK